MLSKTSPKQEQSCHCYLVWCYIALSAFKAWILGHNGSQCNDHSEDCKLSEDMLFFQHNVFYRFPINILLTSQATRRIKASCGHTY